MIKKWVYETSTGVFKVEAVEHNDEVKYNLNAYDLYEKEFDEILLDKEELIKIRDILNEAINLE